jgi:dipeptidase E
VTTRHIVALGGGGFSDQVPFSLLDDFILSRARQSPPRVCFLPTATGDSETCVLNFYRAYAPRPCRPVDLRLFARTIVDLRAFLLEQDVIYIGGGNTANMLADWRTHGVDLVLREAWERGTVLAGVSAGAICWFEAAITDSFGPALSGLRDGLGLLPGSACPHYNSEERDGPSTASWWAAASRPDTRSTITSASISSIASSPRSSAMSRVGPPMPSRWRAPPSRSAG